MVGMYGYRILIQWLSRGCGLLMEAPLYVRCLALCLCLRVEWEWDCRWDLVIAFADVGVWMGIRMVSWF